MAGTCECGNEHSGSIKSGEFLNNNNILQLGCYPVAVVILYVYKI